MKLRLVKLRRYSGAEASVYALYDEDSQETLYDMFVNENIDLFKSEIKNIHNRLHTMGHCTGAREQFFKTKEGKPGDGVCALYDKPNSKLRLYCIRYGMSLIILGGGGHKPKNIKALQEDVKLTEENERIKQISNEIKKRTIVGDISFTNEGMDIEGNLNLYDDEE